MSSILISFIGPDRPGLLADVSHMLSEKGGNISDTTLAVLGGDAELTMIYDLPKGLSLADIEAELKKNPKLSTGELSVKPHERKVAPGPSSRITHRIILAGKDQKGLLAELTKVMNDHGANIVRMNSETIRGAEGDQYIARFAVSLREEKAPSCLAGIVTIAGKLKLTFRYETA